jgi:hypothetical protein
MSEQSSSLYNVVLVKVYSSWVFIKLKRALNVAKVVVLVFKNSRYQVRHVLLVILRGIFGACLIRSSWVTFLLNNICRCFKRTTRNIAFLSRISSDIKNKTICREFLATLNSNNVSWLAFTPMDWHKSFESSCYEQKVNHFFINFVSDRSLS